MKTLVKIGALGLMGFGAVAPFFNLWLIIKCRCGFQTGDVYFALLCVIMIQIGDKLSR